MTLPPDTAALVIAMRSTDTIVSVPHGEAGCKITVTMTEETSLYDILSSAWDFARANGARDEGEG